MKYIHNIRDPILLNLTSIELNLVPCEQGVPRDR